MRPYTVIAAALALGPALAFAQTVNVPTCVVTCIASAAGSTSCASNDIQCLCSSDTFLTDVSSCMQGECSAEELQAGAAVGEEYCAAVGVSVSLDLGSATSSAATESATSSVATESSSSAAAESSSSEAAEISSSATSAAATSSVASAASSAASSVSSMVASATGSAPTGAASGTSGASVALVARGAGAAALIAAGAALAL
ncbi:hypothetical protein JCM3775_005776 [Rhodotorula graminis]